MKQLLFVMALVFALLALILVGTSIFFMQGNNYYLQGGLICSTTSCVLTMLHTRMKKGK